MQRVQQFEVTLSIVRRFEYLTAQACEDKREPSATEHSQYLRPEHDCAIEILRELCAIQHHKWAAASWRYSLRRSQAESHERLIVIAESQTRVRVDELL